MGETVVSTQKAESGVGPYRVRPLAAAIDEPAVASEIRKLPGPATKLPDRAQSSGDTKI
jgi:hypothetical protein